MQEARNAGGMTLSLYRDLKDCELEDEWQELAQDWSAWRCFVQEGVEQLNQRLEQEEVKRKDKPKIRQERHVDAAAKALRCSVSNCGFIAVTTTGFCNHQCQRHRAPKIAQCMHCGKNFCQQGIYNHQNSCRCKPV